MIHQFDHLDPEEADFYKEMTEVIMRHFDGVGDYAAYLADRLISHGVLNPYQVFDRPNDNAALERIDRALLETSRALSALSELADHHLRQALLFGPFLNELPLWSASKEGRAFEEYLNETGKPDHDAVLRVEEEVDRLRSAVKATINHIEKSPKAKRAPARINSRAVGLVEACRLIWKLGTGKPAPASAIQEGTFASFLAEVFDVCEVQAEPRAAFAAWVRETKSTPD